ncbi:MAG: aminotransferase class III-fold pyridoxal phosphate-dependent enzyme [Gammaproteobacteria bacterium]|nr:MAG: aminotransferase class III-fold pyridoxal phosphate-dependent enzyme [Gammaproteobacteria bacterium]
MTTGSHEMLYARACRVTPGGVHSPVRALRAVAAEPLFVARAAGSRLHTTDGRELLDYCLAFGPLIHGHAHPATRAAVDDALAAGWSYGTAESRSLALAEFIVERIDWVEQLRFVNSGTEAVMTALRLARAATGRPRILKFSGCYHGHSDAMLIRAGSGLAGAAVPDSAGIPPGVARDTVVAELNDEDALAECFERHGKELAAAIIEPLPANHGLLPQRPAFLARLQALCRRHGTLLIFDEVISGFRIGFGGMAEATGIRPDLVTWGKVIGGGFPVGAVAGPRDLMEQLAPEGPVYQAGTLSANPVAMAAGLATLRTLVDTDGYARLRALGRSLGAGLSGLSGLRLQQFESLFWIAPGADAQRPLRRPADMPDTVPRHYPALFQAALARGIYLPPSPWECGFLSLAHDEEDIGRLVELLQDMAPAWR